jgi:hypothetical protein
MATVVARRVPKNKRKTLAIFCSDALQASIAFRANDFPTLYLYPPLKMLCISSGGFQPPRLSEAAESRRYTR